MHKSGSCLRVATRLYKNAVIYRAVGKYIIIMKLSEINRGETVTVVGINLSEKAKDRLNRIGLTVGVKLTKIRRAPFGGPTEYKLRDFYIAIRSSQAEKIEVTRLR